MSEQVVQVNLPKRHDGQERVYQERERFNVLSCGRRFGKTTFGQDLTIDDPGYGVLDGQPCGWFAGTSKIFDEVWRLTLATLGPVIQRTDVQKHRVELITGGILDFWSLDGGDRGGAGRGRKYKRVVIDEGALVPDLARIWSEAIRPTLVDLRGDAWFLSTPRGVQNDFHDFWQRGNPDNPKREKAWRSWQMPTHANPLLPREELANLKAEYSGRPLAYRQEILAEFVSDMGEVFKLEWVRAAAAPKLNRLYQAWDLAVTDDDLQRGDYSVGVCGGWDAAGRFWLVDLLRGRWNASELVEQIITFAHKHRAQRFWIEGGPIGRAVEPWLTRRMRESGRQFRFELVNPGTKDKVARTGPLVGIMANGSFYIPNGAPWWPDLAGELASFPGGKHDDQVDALAHLASQVEMHRVSDPEPNPAIATDTAVRWEDNDPDATNRRRRRS
jgi:predicted phage terminase large subunit-like protein